MLAGADAAVQKVELGFENKLSESTAKLTKGGVLELDLKSNPTTGYKWFLSGIDGESVKSQGRSFPPCLRACVSINYSCNIHCIRERGEGRGRGRRCSLSLM